MKIRDLANMAGVTLLTGNNALDRAVTGCYIGDLLSLAMAKVEPDSVWLTIQTNINVVAVASLKDASCVIIVDGFQPEGEVLSKAEEENVVLLSTEESAFEVACRLHSIGV